MATATRKTRNEDTPVDLTDAFTPQQVARMLNVKVKTLAAWRNRGTPNKPPYVPLSPRKVLYPRAQFMAWSNRQKLVDHDAN